MADGVEQIEFVWQGKDKTGNKSGGQISAKSEIIARSYLRKMGVKVISIKKKSKPLFTAKAKKISSGDICVFTRQLATMLDAGVPLVQSFDIIGKGHKNPNMAEMLLSIKTDIERGDSLAEALRRKFLYFDDLFCSLVEAGEQAGVLEDLLDKIATYKEKAESIKKKVKKALTYPIAVLAVVAIVSAVLLIFVVPAFEDLFKSFGADLPSFTKWVISLSEWTKEWWWAVVGSIFVTFKTSAIVHKRWQKFRHFVDKTLLRLPIVGLIINKSAVARFARTLATMSAAGVPLVDGLESTAGACGNIIYYQAVIKIRDDVSTGQRLHFSMEQANLFPHMVIQMVAIGEESGSIEKMLNKVADFYEEEVDNLVDNLSSLMEPIIMVILGVIVGGLIVAMYLPIFKLGAAVG
ncbi:MAG: type II secretion system F family protein [Methylococcales symbiont of Hymedesmia sp. n. MRB-2018]|nr:MAG: type II secretion system F family protein [Methylococcales symbiont of Hymedesmia sp. n. MRB-2018]